MKKACSIVLIAVVCIIGIFALMNYKNANDTKENSEADIYKTSEYQEIIKGSYLTYEEKFDKMEMHIYMMMKTRRRLSHQLKQV